MKNKKDFQRNSWWNKFLKSMNELKKTNASQCFVGICWSPRGIFGGIRKAIHKLILAQSPKKVLSCSGMNFIRKLLKAFYTYFFNKSIVFFFINVLWQSSREYLWRKSSEWLLEYSMEFLKNFPDRMPWSIGAMHKKSSASLKILRESFLG